MRKRTANAVVAKTESYEWVRGVRGGLFPRRRRLLLAGDLHNRN